ncbi:hypothetical protein SAMN04487996_13019 [Dyadobacter soli]|uniref:Uncharacterized protein n=1 Tax=Dyadobacter soli TaxID=659014 RepID=A0A1G8A8T8_9BACT|nr:hypothetical protein [Dyadobacter soli]SDH17286.1 hypothetical protein SAMN04487996_13019 [Dyadobacter soli]
MKTFTVLRGSQSFHLSRLFTIVILSVLIFAESCDQREINEYEPDSSCFTKEFLENEPWVQEELAWFQQPKMGSLRVAVYRYRGAYFLAFENSFLSGPASHIFNCSGQHLGDLQIHYNEFYDNIELMVVLLTEQY